MAQSCLSESVEPAIGVAFVATFVVVIIFTGLVRTRQHWATTQSELEAAEQAAALTKAQATESRKDSPVSTQSSRRRTLNAMSFRPNWIRPCRKPNQPIPRRSSLS